MRKLTIIGLAITAVFAMTAVAAAQYALPVIQVTGTTTPTNAGTKKKPKNGKVRLAFTVNKESYKTVSRIEFFVPRHVRLSGSGFRYCPASKINQQGDAKCPKKSKVGQGTATAVLGAGQTPLEFSVGVFAGSKNELALSLKQTNGSKSINIAFPAPITAAGLPFGQKITVNIPTAVQSPAPGLYSYITGVDTTIKASRKTGKGKKRKVRRFASVRGCPADRTHDYGVQLTYAPNNAGPGGTSDLIRDTSDCKK